MFLLTFPLKISIAYNRYLIWLSLNRFNLCSIVIVLKVHPFRIQTFFWLTSKFYIILVQVFNLYQHFKMIWRRIYTKNLYMSEYLILTFYIWIKMLNMLDINVSLYFMADVYDVCTISSWHLLYNFVGIIFSAVYQLFN